MGLHGLLQGYLYVLLLLIFVFRTLLMQLKLIYDRQSVASLSWCQAPIWDPRPIFFLLEISFRQLWVYYFVASSLTRGQLLLSLARAVTLGSKSRRTHNHILLSHLRLPQPGGPGPCIYIPQEQGGPVKHYYSVYENLPTN
jgi:hypothetical protein